MIHCHLCWHFHPRTLMCIVSLILLIEIFMHSREHIQSKQNLRLHPGLRTGRQLRTLMQMCFVWLAMFKNFLIWLCRSGPLLLGKKKEKKKKPKSHIYLPACLPVSLEFIIYGSCFRLIGIFAGNWASLHRYIPSSPGRDSKSLHSDFRGISEM